ncbi:hypothetical protein GCM10027417_16720 [Glutamicibacter endophyticus]
MVWIAVAAAVCGAFGLAFGAQLQSMAVRSHAGGLSLSLGNIGKLLSSGRWVGGLLLLGLGMVLNVFALASAPLTVVQPIGAIALVITTVVNSKVNNLTLNRPTVMAIISCMAGSVGFVLLAIAVTNASNEITAAEALTIEGILALVVICFGGLYLMFRRRLGAFFYIVAAGVLFGFVAVLVRTLAVSVVHLDGRSLWTLPWLAVVAVVVAGLLGTYFVQNAYSKGPPDLVIAGLTVIDPIVGIALGISILGELRPDVHPAMSVAMAVCALLAIIGVVALSRHHPDVLERRAKARSDKESVGQGTYNLAENKFMTDS